MTRMFCSFTSYTLYCVLRLVLIRYHDYTIREFFRVFLRANSRKTEAFIRFSRREDTAPFRNAYPSRAEGKRAKIMIIVCDVQRGRKEEALFLVLFV